MSRTDGRSFYAASAAEMLALGARLATELHGGELWLLSGELGAGKTTLVRGLLRGLDFTGRVKSPSYGLVESYELADRTVHHLDLYRLSDPGELDFIGLEELLEPSSAVLIEWPERAAGRLPPATRRIRIEIDETGQGDGRWITIETG